MGCDRDALLAQEFMGWGISERSEHTGQLQMCSQAELIICSRDEEGGGRGNVADGSRSKSVCQTVQMANIGGVSGLILKQLRSTLSVQISLTDLKKKSRF